MGHAAAARQSTWRKLMQDPEHAFKEPRDNRVLAQLFAEQAA
jgi:hypothetical protein